MKIIQRTRMLLGRAQNAVIVHTIAGTSLVLAVLPILFANTHALFTHAHSVGELVQALCVAYLAAWIFNLMVVEMPRQRNNAIAMAGGEANIRSLVGVGQAIASKMVVMSGVRPEPNDAPITPEDLALAATKLHVYGDGDILIFQPDGTSTKGNWLQRLLSEKNRKERLAARLTPILYLFDTPLVVALSAYTTHTYWDQVEYTAGMTMLQNTDMSAWAPALSDLLAAGERVTSIL